MAQTIRAHFARIVERLPKKIRLKRPYHYHSDTSTPVTLERRRIFVLPTRQGLLFFVMLFIMLLGATNYNNNMAFALTFLLGSMALISILHTYLNLAGLTLRAGAVAPCFAGERAQFTLHLINETTRPRLNILAECADSTATRSAASQQSTELTLNIATRQRGRHPLGRVTLSSTFPLGLFRAWSYVDFTTAVVVYPRPSNHRKQPPQASGEGSGELLNEPGSDDFYGFRDYQPGDSPRHINWKAWAREQPLMSKQFSRTEMPRLLWLEWGQLEGVETEERLQQLCHWVLNAENRQLSYGLRLPTIELPIASGEAHYHRCLRQLALYNKTP